MKQFKFGKFFINTPPGPGNYNRTTYVLFRLKALKLVVFGNILEISKLHIMELGEVAKNRVWLHESETLLIAQTWPALAGSC